jgi:transcriptional antiterminator RfaH
MSDAPTDRADDGQRDRRWYVAKTHPNAETKARFHLERQGFEVYLPRYLRRVSHARRITWQPRPLFPTYLFVTTSPAQQRWRAINSTIGVAHLICDDRGPLPVPPGIIEEIREGEDADGLVLSGRKIPFEPGTEVQIMSGAFADHVGWFECAADEERVVILLDLLGRQVRTRVKLDAITATA